MGEFKGTVGIQNRKFRCLNQQKKLTITIFVKNMKKEDVTVSCEDQKIHCKFISPDGDEFDRTWHLWGRVKPHKMSYSVVKPKVEIIVPKKTKGDWESLEDKEHEKKNKSSVRRQNMHNRKIRNLWTIGTN